MAVRPPHKIGIPDARSSDAAREPMRRPAFVPGHPDDRAGPYRLADLQEMLETTEDAKWPWLYTIGLVVTVSVAGWAALIWAVSRIF